MVTYLYMIFSLLKKEVLSILKDPASRAVLIVPPIIQAFLFGAVATYDLRSVNYVFEDNDQSFESRELKRKIEGSGFFIPKEYNSRKEIEDALISTDILMIVSVQEDFGKKINNGENAQVYVVTDGRNSTSSGAATSYVSQIVKNYNEKVLGHVSPKIQYRSWFNDGLLTRWNIMPALIVTISMIQTIMIAALSVAREREKGTFEQLLVTPLNMSQLLIGKAIPPIFIGIMQSGFILVVTLLYYKIPIVGSLFELIIGLLCFMSACVGLGLAISSIANNMQQAMLFAFVILVPLALLSGLMSPISNMPEAWQYATMLNPLRYGIDISRRIYLEGATLWELKEDVIPLIIFSMITLPWAGWLFRNHAS